MLAFESVVFYVEDIEASKSFYAKIFDAKSDALSPTFVFIPLLPNLSLGLKQLDQTVPPTNKSGGGTELSLIVENEIELDELYQEWKSKEVRFSQQPTELVFGKTFVALDPDEHRIRVFAPKSE